jgi:hypothetical protein
MASEQHLTILRQGVEAWNKWQKAHPATKADLGAANLHRAKLSGANLAGANLTAADLAGAKLIGANLAKLDLRGLNLSGTNTTGVNLSGADLRRANLIDAHLDGADLTGAKLWESQRTGWSIKGVICQRAFWDREGKEPTEYKEGEFERIFAERPRIVLRYPGGMSLADLAMLPLIVERLQAQHPGSKLSISSVQDDAGGASVTITVEDLEGRDPAAVAAEVEALRSDLALFQDRLRQQEELRWALEGEYRGYQKAADALIDKLLGQRALPRQEFSIGQLTVPMIIEGTAMSRDTYNISGQAGAVGRGAQAQGNTFQQLWSQSGFDLPKLAEELGRLREAMGQQQGRTREQGKAVVAVADAEEAAAKGNGLAALQHLKTAGKWALGIAEKIGVTVAAKAIEKALGQ